MVETIFKFIGGLFRFGFIFGVIVIAAIVVVIYLIAKYV